MMASKSLNFRLCADAQGSRALGEALVSALKLELRAAIARGDKDEALRIKAELDRATERQTAVLKPEETA